MSTTFHKPTAPAPVIGQQRINGEYHSPDIIPADMLVGDQPTAATPLEPSRVTHPQPPAAVSSVPETKYSTRDSFEGDHPLLSDLRAYAAEYANETEAISIWSDQIKITSERAEYFMLANMSRNRKKNKADLAKYTRAMARYGWKLTGETIVFAIEPIDLGNGKTIYKIWLINGQHRLLSCIASGVPFVTLVVYGVSMDAYTSIDSGRPRNPNTTVKQGGMVGPAIQTASCLQRCMDGPVVLDCNTTLGDLDAILNLNPQLKTAIDEVHGLFLSDHPLYPQRPLIAVLYLSVLKSRPDKAYAFLSQMATGSGLDGTSPIRLLREYLQSKKSLGRSEQKLLAVERLCVTALNYFLDDRPMTALTVKAKDDSRLRVPGYVSALPKSVGVNN